LTEREAFYSVGWNACAAPIRAAMWSSNAGTGVVLFQELVQTSRRVAATRGRLAKIELLADLLKRASPEEIEIAVAFLSGSLRQGRLGIGYAALQAVKPEDATDAPTLELDALDAALQRLANATGKGSAREKERILSDLLTRATAEEQEFLLRPRPGALRQGAHRGLLSRAGPRGPGRRRATLRGGTMLAADLGRV